MKKNIKMKLSKIAAICLLAGLITVSCDNDDDVQKEVSSTFSVLSYIDDFAYLNMVDSIETGSVSVIGNGLELTTYGVSAVQHEQYYYVWNYQESTIDQYMVEGSMFTKISSIAVAPLIPDERPRVMRITDDEKLIMNSWGDSKSNVYYALINLPEFEVEKHGSVQLDSISTMQVQEAEFVISGDKAYLGTSYVTEDYGYYCDSTITWVFDYPSFTNQEMLVNDVTSGNNGGYVGFANVTDEKGDVYQAPINSSQWGYDNKEAYILKITDGQYDESYNFNLSKALGKTIGLWSIFYAEDGIAYAKVVENDADYSWGELRNTNTVTLVKIDLYAKTAIELNIEKFNGFFLVNGVVDNGNYYLPISVLDGDTKVGIIDIDGGADDYTLGVKLDGDNVLSTVVYKHQESN